MAAPKFIEPVGPGFSVTSGWNAKRLHSEPPIHRAIDYAAPVGTPVKAMAAGQVISVTHEPNNCFDARHRVISTCKPSGNMIVIAHTGDGQGIISRYMHLSSIARDIKVGAEVAQGQIIGKSGHTGLSDSAHLHIDFLATQEAYFIGLAIAAQKGEVAPRWMTWSEKAPGKKMLYPPKFKDTPVSVGYIPAELFLNNTMSGEGTAGNALAGREDFINTANEIIAKFPTPNAAAPSNMAAVDSRVNAQEIGTAPGGFEEDDQTPKLRWPVILLAAGLTLPFVIALVRRNRKS